MHYRLWAAVAVGLIALTPGTLVAENTTKTAILTDYDQNAELATGLTDGWQTEVLHHGQGTMHQFIDIDAYYPPDPCRGLAVAWNLAVFRNKSRAVFDGILKAASVKSCAISYTRGNAPANGAFPLLSVKLGK
jgi:hypothetical protein